MLHSKRTGTGNKSIVFIHGNSQSSNCWNSVLSNPLFNNLYELIAIDLAGHGKSFRSDDYYTDYSFKGHVKHVGDFLDKNLSNEYILVGNSMATNIIGELAPNFSNCKGIMLTGPALLGGGLNITDIIKPNPNMGISFTAEYTEEQLELFVCDLGHNLSTEQKEQIKNDFKSTDPKVRTCVAELITNNDFSDQILNIENAGLPVAIVYGNKEKVCETSCFNKFTFPKWKDKVIFIGDSGHCSQIDQPEKLSQIIFEFSNEVFG